MDEQFEIAAEEGRVVVYVPTNCGPHTYPRTMYPSHWRRQAAVSPEHAREVARRIARAADEADGATVGERYVIAAEFDR